MIVRKSKKLFSVVDGKITDAALHEEIMAGGDHAGVTAIGRAVAQKATLKEQEFDRLHGQTLQ